MAEQDFIIPFLSADFTIAVDNKVFLGNRNAIQATEIISQGFSHHGVL
jgi:hypothetical protein